MTTERIVIVGGPRRGKSTLACQIHAESRGVVPIFCGDPLSKVKEPDQHFTYLPEDIPFSGDDGAAQWIADNWFPMPGPWVLEGHVMARALHRWASMHWDERHGRVLRAPADRIIVLDRPGFGFPSKKQNAMHKGVMTMWSMIAHYFEPIVEYR
jgi:hypothetical protein